MPCKVLPPDGMVVVCHCAMPAWDILEQYWLTLGNWLIEYCQSIIIDWLLAIDQYWLIIGNWSILIIWFWLPGCLTGYFLVSKPETLGGSTRQASMSHALCSAAPGGLFRLKVWQTHTQTHGTNRSLYGTGPFRPQCHNNPYFDVKVSGKVKFGVFNW